MANKFLAAACEGKSRFETFRLAESIIGQKAKKEGVTAFRCPFCHGFHVGNSRNHKKLGRAPGREFGIDFKRKLPMFHERIVVKL